MIHTPIPFVDLRGKTPVDLLRAYPDRARDLVRASRRSWGIWSEIASIPALPVADRLSLAWLRRHNNPYLHDIETCGELISVPGGVALNLCFEWGCTSGAWQSGETVTLLRILDWPFPDLGKYAVVALFQGRAGSFYSVTWPGMVGVFNVMAPGRFAAAINQAPMRRYGRGYAGDWLTNRLRMRRSGGLPPAHLLRQVSERAKDYPEAKEMLLKMPLAIPAIFTLAGTKPGEGCVIERLEDMAEVMELGFRPQVVTANHFNGHLDKVGYGWRPREIDSAGRYHYASGIPAHELSQEHFKWLKAPVINADTRLAILADAALPRLMVQGYEGVIPATAVFNLPAPAKEQQQAV